MDLSFLPSCDNLISFPAYQYLRIDQLRYAYLTILCFSAHGSQDNYLDAYVRVIEGTDPFKTSLIFSCGMGAVRTTFAMVCF